MHATTMSDTAMAATLKTPAGSRLDALFRKSPLLFAALMSLLFSLVLFALLYSAIHAGKFVADQAQVLQTIDFVRLKRDSEVETLSRRKPPPPPAQPPPPAKMKVAAESVSSGMTGMEIPSLNLSASVSGGPMGGTLGKGVGGMFDGDLLPLQRIPPQYPRDAARAGITGWVQLEVLVNADGSVRSAKVIDAKPRGMFEAAAVQAVMRWKFKPKIEEGKPVEQRGAQKIEFNLNAPKAAS